MTPIRPTCATAAALRSGRVAELERRSIMNAGHANNTERTLVTFLLDRTGSMEPIKDDTIGAFNAYLDGLQKAATSIDFTFVQFDSISIDKVCVGMPVAQVPRLDASTYQPRASTP